MLCFSGKAVPLGLGKPRGGRRWSSVCLIDAKSSNGAVNVIHRVMVSETIRVLPIVIIFMCFLSSLSRII